MRIVTIVGARPQFIKAAMVSRAINEYNRVHGASIEELILHTGQHYDENMSGVFFDQMGIPQPTWQLACGNLTHAGMLAQMLVEVERLLVEVRPDLVLVYGDTNSTLAGALAASKLHIPVAHVEAGLRSFNKRMPEEINRILTDHMASWLFCPTEAAITHLRHEGITEGVTHVGDVMYDAAIAFGQLADKQSTILVDQQLTPKQFYLCTVHREENTDDPERLGEVVAALKILASPECPVVLPLHPRTKKQLEKHHLMEGVVAHLSIRLIPPVDYLDMIMLEKQALTILTDSGGVQKEAYFHRTPCITLRDETEWVETVAAGWNQLAGCNSARILACLSEERPQTTIAEYGLGDAAMKIIQQLVNDKGGDEASREAN